VDRFADLIVGADLFTTSQGQTHIFHSLGTDGIKAMSISNANTTIAGEAPSNQFRMSVPSL